ncbi:hypothetical protein M2105_005965 [Paenibacillus sp. PastF-1]|nr:hypothetical protein [Paenibacillus sp. PastF-2]MDF9851482.1 hypothetical protein [Paenibacillus sp. PastM-2]MDF9858066.1 hypothetical protein [Paenibacillus sp. PastF-1]MDH6483347.1 hypothetical protein [Paenibacillus sp. PastH-2]MDH6510756.1 hypothetical protein [Paenibacillus sp. PastM-3]
MLYGSQRKSKRSLIHLKCPYKDSSRSFVRAFLCAAVILDRVLTCFVKGFIEFMSLADIKRRKAALFFCR